ncbi:hypothetical protein LOAG_06992 [Loa loa]|uniref:G-protein coupled receptors family 1 profile domain-containing protein n=1 Tax=Loa loa TaxID=7209 RepID=A0A1S0TWS1_LOALO|nr:hypothetical protein LOAG_06992 [Loa loa]EFO21496.2 hypothetical protein LOAG_06992 [Loa loa]
MDLAIGQMTENVTSTVSKGKLPLSYGDYFLRTYAYLILGTILIMINIPVFLLVITHKALRKSYLILATVFLNSGFTGISSILLGIKRLIDTANGEQFIDHHKCVINIPIFLFTAEFLSGWSLLMNSAERLSVVAFPIYYYTHNMHINYSLIATHYGITVTAVTTAVVASLIEPSRRISNFCLLNKAYSPRYYQALLLLSSSASMLSVILMVVVVVNLRR